MSCVHADSTTLLWLYGELEDDAADHALHVAACADCTTAVELHSDVAVAVAPVALGLVVEQPVAPRPANNTVWLGAMAALAALLLVGLALRGEPAAVAPAGPPAEAAEVALAHSPVLGARASIDEFDLEFHDLDQRLDALEADLDLL